MFTTITCVSYNKFEPHYILLSVGHTRMMPDERVLAPTEATVHPAHNTWIWRMTIGFNLLSLLLVLLVGLMVVR